MTLEYAIRLARKWAFGGVCSLREGEAQEYHKMALAGSGSPEGWGCAGGKMPGVQVQQIASLTHTEIWRAGDTVLHKWLV